ncbi:MAG: hypothetical protein LBT53_03955 [Puniceicoccales bacterium]|jgi:hypothetical protein|nr:hypothetical protein [Puniceicoccales bacterium]
MPPANTYTADTAVTPANAAPDAFGGFQPICFPVEVLNEIHGIVLQTTNLFHSRPIAAKTNSELAANHRAKFVLEKVLSRFTSGVGSPFQIRPTLWDNCEFV